jgi:TatD DNase family protein
LAFAIGFRYWLSLLAIGYWLLAIGFPSCAATQFCNFNDLDRNDAFLPSIDPVAKWAMFYDTHAHLDFPDFQEDLEAVILRAQAAGIVKIITIGTDFDSSRRAIELAERFPPVYAAVGWHPSYVSAAPAQIGAQLLEWAQHPKVVAIGETGLDYSRLPGAKKGGDPSADAPIKEKQKSFFRQQLEVAQASGLNCIVHQRDAMADTLAILKPQASKVRSVFHCFVSGPDEMRQIVSLNGLVSFTGIITFKTAENVRQAAAEAPLDAFMLETDCPFLPPVPHRGKRCEPAFVADIAALVANTRGCTLEELSAATCSTANRFFPKLARS